jgi:hypothetical protein
MIAQPYPLWLGRISASPGGEKPTYKQFLEALPRSISRVVAWGEDEDSYGAVRPFPLVVSDNETSPDAVSLGQGLDSTRWFYGESRREVAEKLVRHVFGDRIPAAWPQDVSRFLRVEAMP